MGRRIGRACLGLSVVGALVLVGLGLAWLVSRLVRHPWGAAELAGALAVGGLVLAAVAGRITKLSRRGRLILEWELTDSPAESASTDPLAMLSGRRPSTVAALVQTLERAGDDPAVAGLVATIVFARTRPAVVQELADAVRAFRAKGKFAIAYGEDLGNWGYYLATAFDQIFVQPGGGLATIGLGAELNFYGDTMTKAGLQFQALKRHEYKDAFDQLTDASMEPAPREATEALLHSLFDSLTRGIAAGRSMEVDAVKALINRSPLIADEALAAGLIDRIGHPDEMIDEAKSRVSRKPILRYLDVYAKRTRRKGSPSIALVTATGAMVSQRGAPNPLTGPSPMVAGPVAAALRKAAKDKRIKALVLRLDTPGGAVTASETIHREIVRLREAGKPVVISMGAVAASGGYYISAPADRIVAQPMTITGSIGVLSGKPIVAGAKERFAIHPETISTAAHATMMSVNRRFSPSEQERFDTSLDAIYDRFITLVADGRKMTKEAVHEVARGRVWTGADAKRLGLVDELGGLPVALRLAKEAAGITKAVRFKPYPRSPSPLASIRNRRGGSSEDLRAAIATVRALGAAADALGVGPLLARAAAPARPAAGELSCTASDDLWSGA